MTLSLATVLTVAIALTAHAQDGGARIPVPFSVGERMQYEVRFGAIKAGEGVMEVRGIEELRGREAWHTVFTVRGGTFFYKVRDRYESWIDTRTFSSLRHVQDMEEGRRERERTFEIFPDRRVYTENDSEERPSVQDPLDDGSFLYFIRTVPLSVGQTYEFHRYFRPDRNPVTIRVLRRERVKVPAGTFNAIVIQPVIKSRGIFSENGQMQIWLSDDDRRLIVQAKTRLSIGSLNLHLRSYQPGTAARTTGR